MSTTLIVGILAIGLLILVAVAVTLQTIEKNAKDKRRIESALKSRSRNFEYMLEGFPEGFLNRDLLILVCNCLLEVFSQLSKINPKNKEYQSKYQNAASRLEQNRAKPAIAGTTKLTDTKQIKEVQKMLTGLYNFISKLAGSKRISAQEAQIYAKQVRRLMVQTASDALTQPIKDALQQTKPRLAIHYLNMLNEKMTKENNDGFYSEQINHQSQQIAELEHQASNIDASVENNRDEANTQTDEWNKPDDSWKKNALYD
ncbi:MAG: hypothetical protein ACJAYG_000881 [Oceanicoccus sp.]|jgi:uncharacterized protein YjgD (DUF1641 family)